jgi:histone deacetylase complex regulatory component SIN3
LPKSLVLIAFAMLPRRPTPSQKPARELKVEDALLYLDQVTELWELTSTDCSLERLQSYLALHSALTNTQRMTFLQVKMEFSDKPQIYNEFLDIMKNFKAQS